MSEQTTRVRDVFDDWARRGRAEGMERGHGPTARQGFDRLEVGDGTRYLDIGCGNGYTVRWAAAAGARATGLDVSAEMIARARTAAESIDGVNFVCDAFPSAALPADRFDAVFSMEVFYYLDDLAAGLRAVRSLLRPGGRFACVVDFYGENEASHSWPAEMNLPLQLLTEAEWRAAMEAAGLRVVEQARLRAPLASGETPTWKHQEGSLLTLVTRAD